MSPELIGITIGVVFIVPTIYFIRIKEIGSWAWPMFLATLPVYYMLFGLLVLDSTAITKEFLFGLPYFATALVVWRFRLPLFQIVIAIAWISHGFYDYYHDLFFVNPGVFTWYPAFCALVDIAVGGYLLVSFIDKHRKSGVSPTE